MPINERLHGGCTLVSVLAGLDLPLVVDLPLALFWRSLRLARSRPGVARATRRMVQDEVDAREVAHAAAHYAANRERMATTRCMACWVTRAHCMCARLRRLRVATELVDVLVAVHYKEYGKATNTAKLLPHLLSAAGDGAAGEGAAGEGAVGHPAAAAAGGCSLCVYPVEPLQEQLRAAGPTLLLWPGEGSVPAAELRPWVAAQGRRVTLLVIDGSWQHCNLTLIL